MHYLQILVKKILKNKPMNADKKNLSFENCSFVKGVASVDGLDISSIPEIAFLGRSNVGKSSLLNAITKRSKLANTSKTPGRTQELNFFSIIDDKPIINIVDMPGYGYAKVSKKKIEDWTELSKYYLQNRSNLRRVFLLIDSRRSIKNLDEEIMKLLDECAVSYQIVLTKIDKIKNEDEIILKTKNSIKKFIAVHPEIFSTSSHNDKGLDKLRDTISSMVE